jgi:hypothetical protein
MEVNTESEQLSGASSQDRKRAEFGGEVKRPREGTDDKDGHLEYMDDEDDGEYSDPEMSALDSYRQEWIGIYGKTRGSFEDESE